jgi:diadenosine tetraphosphate (Ap4A) HIT family hydrolase
MDNNCPHCDPNSFALKHPLETTRNFYAVCDVHPLAEGHVLIIPKNHYSCAGEYPGEILMEFMSLYDKVSNFIKKQYGTLASFEHGIIGQTVFHSHVHILPFKGKVTDIVPEGGNRIKPLPSLFDLRELFEKEKGYLFFSVENKMYTVDTTLGRPRFFRDRFARALGKPELGDWKMMSTNKILMEKAEKDIGDLVIAWNKSS